MVQIYYLEFEDECLPGQYSDLVTFVSEEKRKKIEKYRFNMDKKLSLYADLLVRYLACTMLGMNNSELKFSKNEYGKPYLTGNKSFKYNISHTKNAIAVSISDGESGVDIEKITVANQEIAERFFLEEETEYIFSEDKDMDKRFYEVWTKKEAYIKWVGKGLSIPLNSFSVLDSKTIAVTSYIIDGYIISICAGDIELKENIIKIRETQLIADVLKFKSSFSR